MLLSSLEKNFLLWLWEDAQRSYICERFFGCSHILSLVWDSLLRTLQLQESSFKTHFFLFPSYHRKNSHSFFQVNFLPLTLTWPFLTSAKTLSFKWFSLKSPQFLFYAGQGPRIFSYGKQGLSLRITSNNAIVGWALWWLCKMSWWIWDWKQADQQQDAAKPKKHRKCWLSILSCLLLCAAC
jgi:hypothetical protein